MEKLGIVNNRYKLEKKIGKGGFSDVYSAIDIKSNKECALKIESRCSVTPMLFYEAKILNYLKELPSVPTIISSGFNKEANFVALEKLGENLEVLFFKNGKKFDLKTTLQQAIKILKILESIHKKYLIHRDIKPDNFLVSTNKKDDSIYLIDYGLAKRFIKDDGTHIPYMKNRLFRGTFRYCSKNMHAGVENSRRDDLESLGYLLVYMFKGCLPWQNVSGVNKEKPHLISKKKKQTTIAELTTDMPEEFSKYFEYVANLEFTDEPNYKYCNNLFYECFNKNNLGELKLSFYKNATKKEVNFDNIKISESIKNIRNTSPENLKQRSKEPKKNILREENIRRSQSPKKSASRNKKNAKSKSNQNQSQKPEVKNLQINNPELNFSKKTLEKSNKNEKQSIEKQEDQKNQENNSDGILGFGMEAILAPMIIKSGYHGKLKEKKK